MKKKVVVLGGGISGLTAAYVLLKKGYETVVLEKESYIGGLSATFSNNNNLLDYGPHNFHTNIENILSFVKEELKVPLIRISISSSKLLFMGKLVDYPLKILNALRNLSFKESFLTFSDYFLNRIMIRIGLRKALDDSFESWIVNRFGRRLYDLYFGPYAKKVWGIAGTEIDVNVAVKKIPEPSLLSLIIRTFTGLKSGKYHSEDPSVIESYYPPKGIGMIADALAQRIKEMGGSIEVNSKLSEVNSVNKVLTYNISGNPSKQLSWDYIINTTPLDVFLDIIDKQEVSRMQREINLHYRSTIFLYIETSKEKIFDYPWIYFNDRDNKELIFNRIYEIGNFSKEMLGSKNGIICIEITCYKDDEIWQKTDAQLYEQCISYLDRNNFLKRDHTVKYFTKRVEVVYPVFKKGYRDELLSVLDYLALRNIYCIGRQGIFSYANIDNCIEMGLKLNELFKNGSPLKEEYFKIYDPYIN